MYVVALGLSFTFMFIELTKIKRVTSWYLALIPLFCLISILGFNRMSRDFKPYENVFLYLDYRENFEFGYVRLVEFLSKHGYGHTVIVFLVGILFLYVLFKYLKNNTHVNLVILCYCIFPLIYDINQTRNTLMYLIAILSLVYVTNEKPVKHYLTLFVAYSMHSFALIYTPFYFLCKLSRKLYFKLLVITTVSFFVLSPLIIKILSNFFPYKLGVYLNNKPQLGVLIPFAYAIADLFTVWWVDKKISTRMAEADKRKMEVLYRFVWFPIIILPFSFYFLTVLRLQRNALLVKYIYCALAMKYMTMKERLFVLLLLAISLSLYIFLLSDLALFEYLDENYIKYFIDEYILY